MSTSRTFAFLVLICFVASNAEGKQYGVFGVGNRSCGAWLSDRRDKGWPALVELSWVEGFVTAMDNNSPKINGAAHATDSDGIAAWIDNYCPAHPLNSISTAAEALTLEMASRH
ncbi:MAG: hypothetical protein ACREHE_00455 [Rhizomicrobium sp.]